MSLDLNAIQRLIDTVNQNHEKIKTENAWRIALGHPVDNGHDRLLNEVNPADILEAVNCLDMLINTSNDVRKALGIKGKPGRKNHQKLNEKRGSDEFYIVNALVLGAITYSQAKKEIIEIFNVDDRTATRFISKLRASIMSNEVKTS